jgi:hypothetical protein
VGLITGLLTLPLAPVRGTMWIAEMIQAEAENQRNDDASILTTLQELELARANGELTDEEAEEAEDALIEELMTLRQAAGQESYGPLG